MKSAVRVVLSFTKACSRRSAPRSAFRTEGCKLSKKLRAAILPLTGRARVPFHRIHAAKIREANRAFNLCLLAAEHVEVSHCVLAGAEK